MTQPNPDLSATSMTLQTTHAVMEPGFDDHKDGIYQATLSIDLGASYTKVAYRPACIPAHNGEQKEEAQVLSADNSPLIPKPGRTTCNNA